MILQISSCLFSTITIHAYYLKNSFYHHFSLLITILSILTHKEKSNIYIKNLDKIIAHYIYLQITISDTPTIIKKNPFMIIPTFLIPIIYWSELLYFSYDIEIHFIMHLITIGTLHIYLYYLEN